MGSLKENLLLILATTAAITDTGNAILGIPDFIEFGHCSDVPLKTNFQPQKYQGVWYDVRRVPNEYQEGELCITNNYTWTGTEILISARSLTSSEEEVAQKAFMKPHKEEDWAYMNVYSTGVPTAPYKVMWTDYESVACVYSCINYYGAFRAEFAWIFSRSRTPAREEVQQCLDIFSSHTIDINKLVVVHQGKSCDVLDEMKEKKKSKRIHGRKYTTLGSGKKPEEDVNGKEAKKAEEEVWKNQRRVTLGKAVFGVTSNTFNQNQGGDAVHEIVKPSKTSSEGRNIGVMMSDEKSPETPVTAASNTGSVESLSSIRTPALELLTTLALCHAIRF